MRGLCISKVVMEGLFGFLIRWHYLIKRDTTVWLKLLMDGDRETPRRFRIMVVCAPLSACVKGRGSHYLLIMSSVIPPFSLSSLFSLHPPFCLETLPKSAPFPFFQLALSFKLLVILNQPRSLFCSTYPSSFQPWLSLTFHKDACHMNDLTLCIRVIQPVLSCSK